MATSGTKVGGDFHNHGTLINNVNSATTKLSDKLICIPKTNQCFYGRNDKFKELLEAIQERRNETHSFKRTIVLHGFGGMGKSETMKAFAGNILQDLDFVWWVDAQTEGSLTGSFCRLAEEVGFPFKTVVDVPKLQKFIANSYNNGCFIFDNAEGLQTKDGQLGIENYLMKEVIPNKPIFLVTSRNGRLDWGGRASEIEIINIDRLKDEEANQVLKKYLDIENETRIPDSLEESIRSLVKTLGGYPLGLSLVGSTIEAKAEELSFDQIEDRIISYTEILKDVDLQGISVESKYEAALDLIYEETLKKMKNRPKGEIAVGLLNIMACLDPDWLFVGLVGAIYCKTTCESVEANAITNPDVKTGLKILQEYSIVKIDEGNRLRIHRLIQQCARKEQNSQESLTKICQFFELNEQNWYWKDYILRLIKTLADWQKTDERNYWLCLLVWRFVSEEYNLIRLKQTWPNWKSLFAVESSDANFVMRLVEFYGENKSEAVFLALDWVEIEERIFNLPPDFANHFWVFRAIVAFLCEYARHSIKHNKRLSKTSRERIKDFVIKQCLNFTNEQVGILHKHELFSTLYGFDSSRGICQDSAFIRKLFASPAEGSRFLLWDFIWMVPFEFVREDLAQSLFSILQVDLFTPSLKFTNEKNKQWFLKLGFKNLNAFLLHLMKDDRNLKLFVKTNEFVNSFLSLLKAFFEQLLDSNHSDSHLLFPFVSTLLSLFVCDKTIYDQFKERGIEPSLERCVSRMLVFQNQQRTSLQCQEYEIKSKLPEFEKMLKKSNGNANWAIALFKIAKSEISITYPEGQKDGFIREMFAIFGVQLFYIPKNFTKNVDSSWFEFNGFLDNLLKIWKIGGNLDKFLDSPEFVQQFMKAANNLLKNGKIFSDFDLVLHFRLSLVLITIFAEREEIHDKFNEEFEQSFEKSFEKQKLLKLKIFENERRLTEFGEKLQKCKQKPKWAQTIWGNNQTIRRAKHKEK